MQVLHRALFDLAPKSSIVAVAEADFRRADEEQRHEFSYYGKTWLVIRRKLDNGRAMKLFIAKELEPCLVCIEWLKRSVVVRLQSAVDKVQIIFAHFAHGGAWHDSLDEVLPWLEVSGWQTGLLGDLNVESRPFHQSSEGWGTTACGNKTIELSAHCRHTI